MENAPEESFSFINLPLELNLNILHQIRFCPASTLTIALSSHLQFRQGSKDCLALFNTYYQESLPEDADKFRDNIPWFLPFPKAADAVLRINLCKYEQEIFFSHLLTSYPQIQKLLFQNLTDDLDRPKTPLIDINPIKTFFGISTVSRPDPYPFYTALANSLTIQEIDINYWGKNYDKLLQALKVNSSLEIIRIARGENFDSTFGEAFGQTLYEVIKTKPHLKSLNIRFCQEAKIYGPTNLTNFFPLLAKNQNFKSLSVQFLRLRPEDEVDFENYIKNSASLKMLSLYHTYPQDNFWQALAQNCSLTSFTLNCFSVNTHMIKSLMQFLERTPSLISLTLEKVCFNRPDPKIRILFNCESEEDICCPLQNLMEIMVGSHKTLRQLSFGDSNLLTCKGVDWKKIIQALASNTSLNSLNISSSADFFIQDQLKLFCEALRLNTHLKTLGLCCKHLNYFGDIISMIAENKTLTNLSLKFMDFLTEDINSLNKVLMTHPSLTEIDLSENNIFKLQIYHLIQGLQVNPKIKKLDLFYRSTYETSNEPQGVPDLFQLINTPALAGRVFL